MADIVSFEATESLLTERSVVADAALSLITAENLTPAERKEAIELANNGYRMMQRQNFASQTQYVNGQAFYQNGNVWVDGRAQNQNDLAVKQIQVGSDEYIALLQKYPNISPWLALGDEVDIVIDKTLYQMRQN